MKARLDKAHKESFAEIFATQLENGGNILVNITHTSRSNLTYRYKVAIAYQREGKTEVNWCTYFMSSVLGKSVTENGEIRGNGLGFDRAYEAATDLVFCLKELGIDTDIRLRKDNGDFTFGLTRMF